MIIVSPKYQPTLDQVSEFASEKARAFDGDIFYKDSETIRLLEEIGVDYEVIPEEGCVIQPKITENHEPGGHKHDQKNHGKRHGSGVLLAKPTDEESEGVKRGDLRLGQCFEEAGRYLLDHQDLDYARLVHGTIRRQLGGGIMAHAWVELGDKIFDGTMQEFFDKDSYYEILDAVPEKKYTSTQMMKKLLQTEHWGHWHTSKGISHDWRGDPTYTMPEIEHDEDEDEDY